MSFLLDLVARVARQQAGSRRNLQSPWRLRSKLIATCFLMLVRLFPRLLILDRGRASYVKRHGGNKLRLMVDLAREVLSEVELGGKRILSQSARVSRLGCTNTDSAWSSLSRSRPPVWILPLDRAGKLSKHT